jgi:hypothetical protein
MVCDLSRLLLLDWVLKVFMGHFTSCSRCLISTRLPLKSLLAEGKLSWTHRDIANWQSFPGRGRKRRNRRQAHHGNEQRTKWSSHLHPPQQAQKRSSKLPKSQRRTTHDFQTPLRQEIQYGNEPSIWSNHHL